MLRTTRLSVLRRWIAVASISVSMLGLAAAPASAAEGSVELYKSYGLSGDRDRLRVDSKIVDSAPNSMFDVSFGLGDSSSDSENDFGSITVKMAQNGADNESRNVQTYSFGQFKNVQGKNCDPGEFYSECNRGAYNWVVGRTYRVVIDRGGKNDNGWLWTVSITDQETNDTSVLMSLRAPFARLSTERQFVGAVVSIGDCANVNPYGVNVQKPVAPEGTTVTWGHGFKDTSCEGATVTNAVDSGVLKLRLAQ